MIYNAAIGLLYAAVIMLHPPKIKVYTEPNRIVDEYLHRRCIEGRLQEGRIVKARSPLRIVLVGEDMLQQ